MDTLLVSWNVNGVRAIMKKNFAESISQLDPEILCLQETKATADQVEDALKSLANYHLFSNDSKTRKGYSGTSILTKKKPLKVSYDMDIPTHDQEGRVVTATFEDFILVNVYTPNAGAEMKRLSYREEWDSVFREYILNLEKVKPVIICGDLNVANKDIDLARPKQNYNKQSGYTQTEIDGINALQNSGYVDSFRHFYPNEVKYSWWNYRFNARSRNVGWRIDYFLVSKKIESKLKNAFIYNDLHGSDHCPVGLLLDH